MRATDRVQWIRSASTANQLSAATTHRAPTIRPARSIQSQAGRLPRLTSTNVQTLTIEEVTTGSAVENEAAENELGERRLLDEIDPRVAAQQHVRDIESDQADAFQSQGDRRCTTRGGP